LKRVIVFMKTEVVFVPIVPCIKNMLSIMKIIACIPAEYFNFINQNYEKNGSVSVGTCGKTISEFV